VAFVLPAREALPGGARRLLHPAALLGLLVVAVPWLEAMSWVRIAARDGLALAYPQVIALPDGEVRLMRRERVDDHTAHVREWDVGRTRLLRDERARADTWRDRQMLLTSPTRHPAEAAWLLESEHLWLPALRWWEPSWRGRPELWRTVDRLADGSVATVSFADGRARLTVLDTKARPPADRVLGSVGPDGWRAGTSDAAAPRFSEGAFFATWRPPALREGDRAVLVDPEMGVVVITWPRVEKKPAEKLDARVIPAPPGTAGRLAPVPQVPYMAPRDGHPLALRASNAVLLLDLEEGEWRHLPLSPDDDLCRAYGMRGTAWTAYVVTRPPYRDTEVAFRARTQGEDAAEFGTTDFVMMPREGLERVAGGVLAAMTLARPPILNATSFFTAPPLTWDELETRWLRDGIVAGGAGAVWLIASLVIGLLCALYARRQARRRCQHASAALAWTAAAFVLGPLALVWMAMLIRRSAVRRTPDGRALAVHVPADWPGPVPTGREVLLGEPHSGHVPAPDGLVEHLVQCAAGRRHDARRLSVLAAEDVVERQRLDERAECDLLLGLFLRLRARACAGAPQPLERDEQQRQQRDRK
jgi:hypothetical protein